ncbi:MAG: DMT family transporter [Xanthobacteraceae bacterium]|nr:DMT family transporter [Xanthobacteraceae bacterium]QYK43862.1 MAG: DMT family transporter [Xanthobacteraceae bacterium]
MSTNSRNLDALVKAAPALFVLLWSTGFIANKYALAHADAMTFVAIRLGLAAVVMALLATVLRAGMPRGIEFLHNAVSGFLVHGAYLCGVAVAMATGMPAGIAALMVGLQPILTSTLANRLLGERVQLLQWMGLALGLVGVWLVVRGKAAGDTTLYGWAGIVIALLGITLGTIYQKRFGGGTDFIAAMPVQYAAAALLAGAGAFLFEDMRVEHVAAFWVPVAWNVFVLSCGAIVLLYMLIRRAAATRVVSLFYLTPPTTAVMSYALFGEQLGLWALIGMALCVAGVLLVNWKAAPSAAT